MDQWLGLCTLTAKSLGSIPNLRTKDPANLVVQPGKKKTQIESVTRRRGAEVIIEHLGQSLSCVLFSHWIQIVFM